MDSGCGATLVNKSFLTKLKNKCVATEKWKTKAGNFTMSQTCKVQFALRAFHKGCKIEATVYVDKTDAEINRYDMIIGQDLLHLLGIDLLFSTKEMS